MSTWIGLEVTCNDERWEKVNQLTSDEDAPHVTLAYMGTRMLSQLRQRELYSTVARWYTDVIFPFTYQMRVIGTDMFGNGACYVLKVEDVITSKVSMLAKRDDLASSLDDNGFDVDNKYPFSPHVTVGHFGYVDHGLNVEDMILDVRSLFVRYNGHTILERRHPF